VLCIRRVGYTYCFRIKTNHRRGEKVLRIRTRGGKWQSASNQEAATTGTAVTFTIVYLTRSDSDIVSMSLLAKPQIASLIYSFSLSYLNSSRFNGAQYVVRTSDLQNYAILCPRLGAE